MSNPILTLREKVAQQFIVGTEAANPLEELEPFFKTGLGGFLAFRHHLQPYQSAQELQAFFKLFQTPFSGSGLSFISIDQEGGQVERLPHWLFPAGINAISLGLKNNSHWTGRGFYVLNSVPTL